MRTDRGLLGFCVVLLLLAGCGGQQEPAPVEPLPPTVARGPAPEAERIRAYLELSQGYLDVGETGRAKLPLERALELNRRSWEAHAIFGRIYQVEGEFELAEEHFRRAIRIAPSNPRVRNDFGVFLYERSRFAEAVEQLEVAVRDPNSGQRHRAYENLGLANLQIRETESARTAFRRAVLLDDSLPVSLLELTWITFEAREIEASAAYYQRFREVGRQNARSLLVGALLAREQRDPDAEASYALQLRNQFPQSVEYRRYREVVGQ